METNRRPPVTRRDRCRGVRGARIRPWRRLVLHHRENGSRLTLTATVEFKVPLVGGTIESYIAREFAEGIPEIQRFTTEWISEHA